ncbi:hypothetical protein H0H92_002499 [Tricholoma furcatifolium]|nr:hypothetical protein H0H92_002499 [Tricholoma furcatifolium]
MTTGAEAPFSIAISDAQLNILQQKLSLATFPDELEDAGVAYGAALPDVKRLVEYWRNGYDWRKHEKAINTELPQFTRDITVTDFGTLNIHYVHKRSAAESAIPLLFVHGWPGSFLEVRKILPLLVDAPAEHPCFHVVALSLPGFGFSEAPTKKRFALDQYAEVAHKLMLALGYDQYVQLPGQLTFLICKITRRMAKTYGPKHIKAWHTNFPLYVIFLGYTEREKAGLERTVKFLSEGSGYSAIQSTRPQTLGYGLTDSPVGLLAWIYEKLAASVANGGKPFSDDEGPAASLRIYYEVVQVEGAQAFLKLERTTIPLGHSYFPNEAVSLPKSWHRVPNLVFESEHDAGGHFAAFEEPEALVADLRAMFGKNGPAFGVIKGNKL